MVVSKNLFVVISVLEMTAFLSTYIDGQDISKYDAAYEAAYNMGKSGVDLSYAMSSQSTAYLTESQRELAYKTGADASSASAQEQDTKNKAKANGKTIRKKGTVRGDGVTISDIKKAVNDTQGVAYKLLTTYAEATGIDIVLYKSDIDPEGKYEGAQGKFKWSEDTIYIDINAGLSKITDVDQLSKYTMLRTFAHEFTHFIEKWNPIWYNEFRRTVFDTLTERGENVEDLIDIRLAADTSGTMSYDDASREVVAEAMTDILPDAEFVEKLATEHKTVFDKLLERLKAFVSELRAYFAGLSANRSREANALKEQMGDSIRYAESIVKLFDKVAVEAVENYQSTVATEDGSPVYETFENRTPVVPYDRKALQQSRIEANKKFALTDVQGRYLGNYVECAGFINAKMLSDNLSEADKQYIYELQNALNKFPTFSGRTYRNLKFTDVQSYNDFLEEHMENKIISLKSFASTSKNPNGYPLFGQYVVHMVFEGVSGRDIADTYGIPRQQEVLYLPRTKYVVNSVTEANDGKILIYVKEIASNEEIQVNDGDHGGYESEFNRMGRGNTSVPQGEGNDNGGIHADRRRSEDTGEEISNVDADLIEKLEKEGTPTIYLTEVISNAENGNDTGRVSTSSQGNHSGEQGQRTHSTEETTVQSVQTLNTKNMHLQSVSEVDTGRGLGRKTDLQGVQEQSREYLNDDYPTDGVHWMYKLDGIDNSDVRFVWEVISNINKRGYKGYTKTVDGEYIADNGNKIFFINTDFENPYVSRVIILADSYETNMFEAKEMIRYAKGDETGHREAMRTIEISQGEGYAIEYEASNSSSYGRQNRRGEGSDSRGNPQQTKVREWHFDTEQEQGRTTTLTDAEILSMAAEQLEAGLLTEGEGAALQIFKDRLSKLEDLQRERAAQGRLYREQQFVPPVDRAAAEQTLHRMGVLDTQIKKAQADMLSLEDKKVFGDILKKARKVVETEERKQGAEMLRRWRDRTHNAADIKKYRAVLCKGKSKA